MNQLTQEQKAIALKLFATAKELIDSQQDEFVCLALETAYARDHYGDDDVDAVVHALKTYITDVKLDGSFTLGTYFVNVLKMPEAVVYDKTDNFAYMRNKRLDFIDELVAELQA